MTQRSALPAMVVAGEALVDEFASGPVPGGAPFNVARALGRFGCAPLLVSRVGTDHYGQLVESDAQTCGIDTTGLQHDRSHQTGVVQVHATGSSHRFEIMPNQAYDHLDSCAALLSTEGHLAQRSGDGLLYFGTLIQRSRASHDTLHQLLGLESLRKFLDLNLRDNQVSNDIILAALHVADMAKLNDAELRTVCQLTSVGVVPDTTTAQDVPQWLDAMRALAHHFGLKEIIVTMGGNGYLYCHQDGSTINGWQSSGTGLVMVDTVGCGDAFSAVFLTGTLHHWPVALTLQRANQYAAAICTVRGAVSPDPDFYRNWKSKWQLH